MNKIKTHDSFQRFTFYEFEKKWDYKLKVTCEYDKHFYLEELDFFDKLKAALDEKSSEMLAEYQASITNKEV